MVLEKIGLMIAKPALFLICAFVIWKVIALLVCLVMALLDSFASELSRKENP